MSDGMFLLLAAAVLTVFVLVVLAPKPERRSRKWWQRNPK